MKISELTRRDILDELRMRNTQWYGRLDEVAFLSRLFELDALPSHDSRFKDMAGDIWQHRINNLDWDDWWVFDDGRLSLNTNDNAYLKFLCEMIHPVVRSDEEEVAALLGMFNRRLIHDGWKIIEKERISGKPVFIAVSTDANVPVQKAERIGSAFALSQLQKCDDKIAKGDFDGAISAARSLLESVFADIYHKTTGERMEKGGKLLDSYKVIRNLLNLSEDKYSNEAIKGILRSLTGIVGGLDELSNDMGDRHIRPVEPQRHHALLCVNSVKTLVNFLYDTIDYRFKGKENIFQQLLDVLDSDLRLLESEELRKHREVQKVYARTDPNIRALLKRNLIESYEIDSYRDSDIFFGALTILRDDLKPADIDAVYVAHKDNSQACGLGRFLKEMREFNPLLIPKATPSDTPKPS